MQKGSFFPAPKVLASKGDWRRTAWQVGVVPKQHCSGGKQNLLSISRLHIADEQIDQALGVASAQLVRLQENMPRPTR